MQGNVFGWTWQWLTESDAKILIHQGGTYSGKTYSCMAALCLYAATNSGKVITVTSEDLPALRRNAIRELDKVLTDTPQIAALLRRVGNPPKYQFANGSVIEFVTFDSEADARQGKRDVLFVDECNTVKLDVFTQLELRTTSKVIVAFNPSARFWAHDLKAQRNDVQTIISTYRDNPKVPISIKRGIEAKKETDPEFYRVYGLGLTGRTSNAVYRFKYRRLPLEAEHIAIGLDWGFSQSPTAAVLVSKCDGDYYFKELCYETGLMPNDLHAYLNKWRDLPIIADPASPMANEQLRRLGYYVPPFSKPRVEDSINMMRSLNLCADISSANLIYETNNYVYGKDGRPIKDNDHLLDAARYAIAWYTNFNGSTTKVSRVRGRV